MVTIPKRITEFLNQIDRTYTGLGLPVLYGTLSVIACRSVFFLGERGKGKTLAIRLVPQTRKDEQFTAWDSFTLSGLSQDVGEVSNQRLVWTVDDLSTLSQYHRDIFLTVCSKIISDGNYYHSTKSMHINIERCKLTLLVAVQPRLYSELCRKHSRWESMSYDRFSKFLLLNPLKRDITDTPLAVKVPAIDGGIEDVRIGHGVSLDKIENLYKLQLSENRAYIYARDYVKSLALFLGEKEVKQNHVELFYSLFSIYLDTFNALQYRKSLDQSLDVSEGQLLLLGEIANNLEGVRKDEVAESLRVSEREVEVKAGQLLEKGLIMNETHRGKKGEKTVYRSSPTIQKFFANYAQTLRHV